jgi:hypothetical protein
MHLFAAERKIRSADSHVAPLKPFWVAAFSLKG